MLVILGLKTNKEAQLNQLRRQLAGMQQRILRLEMAAEVNVDSEEEFVEEEEEEEEEEDGYWR